MEKIYASLPAYKDAHCAGFLGWTCPTYTNGADQQAADRGYLAGCKARDKALASR